MRRSWQFHRLGVFIAVAILSHLAWAETLEMVTYYPAPGATASEDLHVRSLTVGTNYNNETPGDGETLIFDRLGIGTNAPAGPLHVVGEDDTASVAAFMAGANTAAAGSPSMRIGIGTTTPQTELHIMDSFGGGGGVVLRLEGTREVAGGHQSRIDLLGTGSATTADQRYFQILNSNPAAPGGSSLLSLRPVKDDLSAVSPGIALTHAGNVGIGTSAPQTSLDVAGAVRFGPGNRGGRLNVSDPGNFGGKEVVLTVADGAGGANDEIWIGPNVNASQGHIQLVAPDVTLTNGGGLGGFLRLFGGNVGVGVNNPRNNPPNGTAVGNADVNDLWVRSANAGAGQWVSAIAAAGGGGGYDGVQTSSGGGGASSGTLNFNRSAFGGATQLMITFVTISGAAIPNYTVQFNNAAGNPLFAALSMRIPTPTTDTFTNTQIIPIPRSADRIVITWSRGTLTARLLR